MIILVMVAMHLAVVAAAPINLADVYLVTPNGNRDQCQAYCEGNGMGLVSIHSHDQLDALTTWLYDVHGQNQRVWIGAQTNAGSWMWLDSSAFDYANWDGESEPTASVDYGIVVDVEGANKNLWYPESKEVIMSGVCGPAAPAAPVVPAPVACSAAEEDALCPGEAACQSLDGVFECCTGDDCAPPACPETLSNQCHHLAYCSGVSGTHLCSCPEGLFGTGLGNAVSGTDAGCSKTAWTVRTVFDLPERSSSDVTSSGKLHGWAGQQRALARVLHGIAHDDASNDAAIPLHFLTSMHHVATERASGGYQLTVNAIFSDQSSASAARVSMEAALQSGLVELFGTAVSHDVEGSWTVDAGVLVWGPREYRWVAKTTSAELQIMATGLNVVAVYFKPDCEETGCWVVDVTYTTGEDNFNIMYIPNAVGDDSLSFDFDYAAVPSAAPWSTWSKAPASTFQASNFPCGSSDYVGVSGNANAPDKVTACCIPEFIDLFRPVASFAAVPVSKAGCDAGAVPVFAQPNEQPLPVGKQAMPPSALEGPFKGMAHASVVSLGVVDPYVGIYQARLYLDEVELRTKAGILKGTVGVEHTIDTFVGIANFKPTSNQVLDAAAYQAAIHLEKTSFFTVSTHGVNDYTFLEYVNLRLVAIYAEDTDPTETVDENGIRTSRTNSSGAAHYVQVTFTLGAQYQPIETGLIPLDSVRVGKGGFFQSAEPSFLHPCSLYAANSPAFPRATFDSRLPQTDGSQACAPRAAMCVNPATIPDQFVSFNVPLGIDWLPAASTDLSANVFVDMVVSAIDQTQIAVAAASPNAGAPPEQMKTTLTASIPVVAGGVNIFCDGITAKTDLKDVANADIIIGSAGLDAELSRLRILVDVASTDLGPVPPQLVDSSSIESGLMTLVVKGNADYFTRGGSGAYGVVVEDIMTVHVMESETGTSMARVAALLATPGDDNNDASGLDTDGYKLNGAFAFVVDRAAARAFLEPTAALLDLCPFNPVRPSPGAAFPSTCVLRRDVQRQAFPARAGSVPTAIELPPASVGRLSEARDGVASFMQDVFGASDYAAALGRNFSYLVAQRYALNGQYTRAFWVNPGYEWTPTQTGGQSKFALSQRIALFALISLDEGFGSPDFAPSEPEPEPEPAVGFPVPPAGSPCVATPVYCPSSSAAMDAVFYAGAPEDGCWGSTADEEAPAAALWEGCWWNSGYVECPCPLPAAPLPACDTYITYCNPAGAPPHISSGIFNYGPVDAGCSGTTDAEVQATLSFWDDCYITGLNPNSVVCKCTHRPPPPTRRRTRTQPRRMLLSSTEKSGSGLSAAEVEFKTSPASMLASAFGVREELVGRYAVELAVTAQEACASSDALRRRLRASLDSSLQASASPFQTVEILSVSVDRQGVLGSAESRRMLPRAGSTRVPAGGCAGGSGGTTTASQSATRALWMRTRCRTGG